MLDIVILKKVSINPEKRLSQIILIANTSIGYCDRLTIPKKMKEAQKRLLKTTGYIPSLAVIQHRRYSKTCIPKLYRITAYRDVHLSLQTESLSPL